MNWYANYVVDQHVARLCEIVKASAARGLVALATVDPTSPRYQEVLNAVRKYMGRGGFENLALPVKEKILRKWMGTAPTAGGLGIGNVDLQTEILNALGVNIAGANVMPTSREFRERGKQEMQKGYYAPNPKAGPNLPREWGPGGSAVPGEEKWRIPHQRLQPA